MAAEPGAWADAGFAVEGNRVTVEGVAIEFVDDANELVWGELQAGRGAHPNGVTSIDHVVLLARDLDQKIAELEGQGFDLRRIREGETGMGPYRQAFFRVGRPILEVVEADRDGFWGITFTTADIDAAAAVLGERLGRIKDAVQPGRRIATVRREAGLGLPVALISPKPRDP